MKNKGGTAARVQPGKEGEYKLLHVINNQREYTGAEWHLFTIDYGL